MDVHLQVIHYHKLTNIPAQKSQIRQMRTHTFTIFLTRMSLNTVYVQVMQTLQVLHSCLYTFNSVFCSKYIHNLLHTGHRKSPEPMSAGWMCQSTLHTHTLFFVCVTDLKSNGSYLTFYEYQIVETLLFTTLVCGVLLDSGPDVRT